MCNSACLKFCFDKLNDVNLSHKKILEIGSYNVNGSVRFELLKRNPLSYTGIDMAPGPCVDEICNVYDIVERFGYNSFDIVISTEMMEHVEDWRLAINNIKRVCKPGGRILITTRSYGFPLHGYPLDYWRFELYDMEDIFSDFINVCVEKDPIDIGVFIGAVKPNDWMEKDLTQYQLYNIISNKRCL